MFQTKGVQKIKTYLCSMTFSFRKSFLLRDNVGGGEMVEPDRPEMTKWRTYFVCQIIKARIQTHTQNM